MAAIQLEANVASFQKMEMSQMEVMVEVLAVVEKQPVPLIRIAEQLKRLQNQLEVLLLMLKQQRGHLLLSLAHRYLSKGSLLPVKAP